MPEHEGETVCLDADSQEVERERTENLTVEVEPNPNWQSINNRPPKEGRLLHTYVSIKCQIVRSVCLDILIKYKRIVDEYESS